MSTLDRIVKTQRNWATGRVVIALSLALALLLSGGLAEAKKPAVLRPGTHPWFVTGGVGPSFGLQGCARGRCASHYTISQLKIAPEFGYHFSGDFEGPAIGGGFDTSFLNDSVRFEPGFKFWWDIKIIEDLGVYVTPFAKVGYGLNSSSRVDHFFHTQGGASGRLMLADRAVVFVQPVTINVLANGDGVAIAYEVLAGGGVTWGK